VNAAPDTKPAPAEAQPAQLPSELLLAFAPLHKAAFGAAIGTAFALLVFLATVLTLLLPTPEGPGLWLLGVYFRGYTVSWGGAFIGALWAGFAGFVFGWFIAFCRNFILAVSLFVIRTRAELARTRDFLDHV
jgi:hypothetical protein